MSVDRRIILNAEDLVQCPYDKSHMIREKRMVYHLRACRMNHPGVQLVACCFNAKHMVRANELRHHIAHCADKCRIEPQLQYERQTEIEKEIGISPTLKGYTDVPAYNEVILGPSDDDWDIELEDILKTLTATSVLHNNMASPDNDLASRKTFINSSLNAKIKTKASAPKIDTSLTDTPADTTHMDTPTDTCLDTQAVRTHTMAGVKLPLAGVGRGRAVSGSSPPRKSHEVNESPLKITGRGRALSSRSALNLFDTNQRPESPDMTHSVNSDSQ